MPIAKFQMPDGRIARFEVPEGTTPEQAQSMMESAAANLGGNEDYGVQKSVSLKDTKGKPPASWDVTVDGRKIKATFVKDKGEIGSYQFVDDDGQVKKVMRDPKSGSLMLQPLEKPSALGSDVGNFAAGAGKAASDLGTFGKQAGSLIGNTLGLVSDETVDRTMQEAADKRGLDEELMDTKAGVAGNIAGNVATMIAGGGALRGAAAGAGRVGQGLAETGAAARTGQALQKAATVGERAGKGLMMPTTKGGAAASGAVMGGAQPFADAEDIAKNAAIGGAAGAAGQALGQGLGKLATAVASKIKSLRLPPATTPAEISAQANTYDAIVRQEAAAAGIDWRKLPEAQRQQFAQVVKDAIAKPESTDIEAAKRIARAESQNIPITRAQAEKDVAAMRAQNAGTLHSKDLQEFRTRQREALNSKIDELIGETGAPSGGSLVAVAGSQKGGMRAFQGASRSAYEGAYKKAEIEAGDSLVDPTSLVNWVKENRGYRRELSPIIEKMKDLGVFGVEKQSPVKIIDSNRDSIKKELESAISSYDHDAVGLRVIPAGDNIVAGGKFKNSNRFSDGVPTNDDLGGTSTIIVRNKSDIDRAISTLKNAGYDGDRIAIVTGDFAGYGEDAGEGIISNAKAKSIYEGNGEVVVNPIKASDLYLLRKEASRMTKTADRAFLGKEAKAKVDSIYDAEEIPQYVEAANLRRAHAKQFDERAIPARLVGKKGQEDIAKDDSLVEWLIAKDTKDIGQYKQALVSGNEALLKPVYKADKDARKLGIQSARDMKAGFMRYLQNQAMYKDEMGQSLINPNSLVTAYRKLGKGDMETAHAKAQAVLGKKMADRLKFIVQTADDISVPTAAQMHGSSRTNESLARGLGGLIQMVVEKTPLVGKTLASKGAAGAQKASGFIEARPAKISAYQGARAVPALSAPAVSGAEDRKR